jgi:hypothetical protein
MWVGMEYGKVRKLSGEEFRRLTGVKSAVFEEMASVLQGADDMICAVCGADGRTGSAWKTGRSFTRHTLKTQFVVDKATGKGVVVTSPC